MTLSAASLGLACPSSRSAEKAQVCGAQPGAALEKELGDVGPILRSPGGGSARILDVGGNTSFTSQVVFEKPGGGLTRRHRLGEVT